MHIKIDTDECYAYFIVPDNSAYGTEINIPQHKYELIKSVDAEFWDVQDYICDEVEKVKRANKRKDNT